MNTVSNKEEATVQAAPAQPAETEREFVRPEVNILETAEGYVLEAVLPGVNKDGLTLSVEDNVLSVTGRRRPAPQGRPLHQESGSADYRRSFELDPSVDASKITAKLEQGLLTVTLPKAEKAKARQIPVS